MTNAFVNSVPLCCYTVELFCWKTAEFNLEVVMIKKIKKR